MASKNLRAGLRSFSVTTAAGAAYAFDVSDGTAEVTPSTRKRELVASATSTRLFKESPQPGKIVVEVIDAGNLAISDIDNWDDITAHLVLANGKSYAIQGCATDAPSLDAQSGKFTITIEGDVQEVTFG